MRLRRPGTKAIGIGPVTFDGWEVLLGGGLACIIAASVVAEAPDFLLYIGIGAIVLWLVAVLIVNVRDLRRREPQETSGGGKAGGSTTNP